MPPVQHFVVTPAETGLKLVQFLERRLHRAVAGGALMRWIRTGQVRVDGGRAKPFQRVTAGQDIRLPPYDPGALVQETGERPALGLPVVHEDDALLVVAKPPGLATQPGARLADSVDQRVRTAYAGADYVPALVHRLDKETSGLLVLAKTASAAQALHEAFRQRTARKTYLAWVRGAWPETGPVTLADQLAKAGRGRRGVVTSGGQAAVARVRPLRVAAGASLLAVELLTGRMHQIRVQLASRGHPIVGDTTYGQGERERKDHGRRLLLHAWRLEVMGQAFALLPDWDGEWTVDPAAAGLA